jgi:hypothetical protein
MVELMFGNERIPDANLERARPVFALRSRIPGRDRWQIPALIQESRLGLALETILASEPGILRISANRLTGRVLVQYDPEELEDSVENLLRKALDFGPMLPLEQDLLFANRASRDARPFSAVRLFLGAELGCMLFKVLFLSAWCPAASVASTLAFVLLAGLKTGTRTRRVAPTFAITSGVVLDEASGIDDDEDRAEIMQDGRDDRVD